MKEKNHVILEGLRETVEEVIGLASFAKLLSITDMTGKEFIGNLTESFMKYSSGEELEVTVFCDMNSDIHDVLYAVIGEDEETDPYKKKTKLHELLECQYTTTIADMMTPQKYHI